MSNKSYQQREAMVIAIFFFFFAATELVLNVTSPGPCLESFYYQWCSCV